MQVVDNSESQFSPRVGMLAELGLGYNFSGMYAQLINLRKALSNQGVDVRLYDMWNARHEAYDVVHVYGLSPSLHSLIVTLDHLSIPYVVSPNYWPVRHTRANRLLSLLDLRGGVIAARSALQRRILLGAQSIIVASTGERDALARTYRVSPSNFVVIPNAVEREFGAGDPQLFRDEFSIDDDFVLTVAEVFNETKNHLRLLRAWTRDMPRLVFVGNELSDDYAERCMKEARALGNVTVVGPLPHEGELLKSAYAACSAFVLPSLVETTGLAALEAAVAGAPIAITEVGGTKDYFGADAFYCTPRSSRSIRKAVQAAIASGRDEERAARFMQMYDWDHVAKLIRDAYRSALMPQRSSKTGAPK